MEDQLVNYFIISKPFYNLFSKKSIINDKTL